MSSESLGYLKYIIMSSSKKEYFDFFSNLHHLCIVFLLLVDIKSLQTSNRMNLRVWMLLFSY